jgi:hypothetical protein
LWQEIKAQPEYKIFRERLLARSTNLWVKFS